MQQNNLRNGKTPSLRSNYIWNTSYQVVRMLTPIITTPYLARVLGSEALGAYSYTYAIASYFTYFCLLGLGQYGNREVASAKNKSDLSSIFSSIFTMQIAIGLVVVFCYFVYAMSLDGIVRQLTLVWSIWVLAEAVDISWLYYGLEEFRTITIRNILIRAVLIIGVFLLIDTPDDLPVYCFLQAMGFALNSAVLWCLIKGKVFYKLPTFREVIVHLRPNLILFIPVIAISIYTQLNVIFLGKFGGLNDVAYYDNAYKIITISLTVIQSLGTVMLPRMSSLVAAGNENEVEYHLRISFLISQVVAYCFAFGIIGVSFDFVPFFFGPGFDSCALLMIIFALMIPLCAWSNVLGVQYLVPFGKDLAYLVSVLCGAVVNLAACIPLIQLLGVYGAAISAVLAEFAVTAAQAFFVRHDLSLSHYVKAGFPYVCFGIIELIVVRSTLVVFNHSLMALVVSIFAGGVVYVIPSALLLHRSARSTLNN